MSRVFRAISWSLNVVATVIAMAIQFVYELFVRIAYSVCLLLCLVHFTAADPGAARLISHAVSQSIPGAIEIERIHISPLLRDVQMVGGRTFDKYGHKVIEFRRADAQVDRNSLASWLAKRLSGENIMFLRLDRARVYDAWAEVDVSNGDEIPILRAFVPRFSEQSDEESMTTDFQIRNAQVFDLHIRQFDSTREVNLYDIKTDAQVVVLGSTQILAPEVHAKRGTIRLKDKPQIPLLNLTKLKFTQLHNTSDRVVFGGLSMDFEGIRMTGQGRIGHDMDQSVDGILRGDTGLDNSFLRQIIPGLRSNRDGMISVVARVSGSMEIPDIRMDVYTESAQVNDLEIRQGSGLFHLGPVTHQDGIWDYHIAHLRLKTNHGTLRLKDIVGGYDFLGPFEIRGSGHAELAKVNLTRMSEAIQGIPTSTSAEQPPPPNTITTGTIRTDFSARAERLVLGAKLNLSSLVSAQVVRNVPHSASRRSSVEGLVLVHREQGTTKVTAKNVTIRDDVMRIRADGALFFPEGPSELTVSGNVATLKRLTAPLAPLSVEGGLQNARLTLTGSFPRPKFSLQTAIEDLRTDTLKPLSGSANATLSPSGLLKLNHIDLSGSAGMVRTSGTLQLLKANSWDAHYRRILKLNRIRAQLQLKANLPKEEVSGYLNIRSPGLTVDLNRPLPSLDGQFQVNGQHLQGLGYRMRTLQATGRGRNGVITVQNAEATLREGGSVRAKGRIDGKTKKLNLRVQMDDFNLRNMPTEEGLRSGESVYGGVVNAKIHLTGTPERPRLEGPVKARGVRRKNINIGRVEMNLSPFQRGGAVMKATRLPRGYQMDQPSVIHLEPKRRWIETVITMDDAEPMKLLARYKGKQPKTQVLVDGTVYVDQPIDDYKQTRPTANIKLPQGGLRIRSENLVENVRNVAPIAAYVQDNDTWIPEAKLIYQGAQMKGCGIYRQDGALEFLAHGEIPLAILTMYRSAVSEGSGLALIRGTKRTKIPQHLKRLCPGYLLSGEEIPMALYGPLDKPHVEGEMRFMNASIKPTSLRDEVRFPNGWGLRVESKTKLTGAPIVIKTMDEVQQKIIIGEGRARATGTLSLKGLRPDRLDLILFGEGVDFNRTGVSDMTLRTPQNRDPIVITGRQLSDPRRRTLVSTGTVRITDGRYRRSFDALSRAVGGVFGRRMDSFSRPITEVFPLLGEMALKFNVVSSSFRVESPFPLGRAELDLDVNLSVTGTAASPNLKGLVGIRPSSTITYAFGGGRKFNITEGTIEFQGEAERPYIELSANSEITYSETTDDSISSRAQNLDFALEETVIVTIRIKGYYPDDLNITFESDRPEFDKADIQSLILLGVPTGKNTGNLDPLAETTLHLVTEDLSKLLSNLLLTPFIDSVNLGFNQSGGVSAEVLARLGRYFRVNARVMQSGTDTRYDTGFQVKFTDRFYLEGKLKLLQQEQDQSQTYEAKLKYRIPLDD